MAGPRPIISSVPLQMLYTTNIWFFTFWWIVEFAVFIWKGYELPYPSSSWGSEFFLLWLTLPIECIRIFFGMKGNLTEQKFPLIISFLMSLPTVGITIFFLVAQTYVLRVEVVICAMMCVFLGLEFLFGFIAALNFARNEPFHT
eukprot:m.24308 g.24308  ORF g.24308 m.24308 type:complete len:144 (+) comp9549_c0_seq1:177-608(+)